MLCDQKSTKIVREITQKSKFLTLKKTTKKGTITVALRKKTDVSYQKVLSEVKQLVQQARIASARSVNAVMTATYWEIGRRIVQIEQKGKKRAEYGKEIVKKLAQDLTKNCGKGFGERILERCRQFYLLYYSSQKSSTVLTKSFKPLKSQDFFKNPEKLLEIFPLPWSAYVSLMSVKDETARKFYEEEALQGGWSVRQLNRQISTLFFERTALSKNKAAMLTKGAKPKPQDKMTPEEAIKDPYILEFLELKDEYSESELEEALILHLQNFLLELGGDFTFIGRQKRLKVGDQWFRVDLVFYHRLLKCLIIIDLKTGKFSHADAGQMNMYLNYAEKHWTHKGENPPIGLILCTEKDNTVVEYTLKGMRKNIVAADYMTKLPSKKILTQEIEKTKKMLELKKAKHNVHAQNLLTSSVKKVKNKVQRNFTKNKTRRKRIKK